MTENDIKRVINSFTKAASRADKAGFELAEIHAAHGYLLHQFYSQSQTKELTHMAMILWKNSVNISCQGCKKVWPPNKVLCFRISFTDWTDLSGWVLEDSIKLCKKLKK